MNYTAEQIKKRRQALGISQAELAKRIGYTSRSTICKIEKGEMQTPLDSIPLLAEVFGCSTVDLVGDQIVIETASSPNIDEARLLNYYRYLSRPAKSNAMQYLDFLAKQDRRKGDDDNVGGNT